MIFFMTKDRKVNYVSKTNIDSVIYLGGGGGGYLLPLYSAFIIITTLTYYKHCWRSELKYFFFHGTRHSTNSWHQIGHRTEKVIVIVAIHMISSPLLKRRTEQLYYMSSDFILFGLKGTEIIYSLKK